MCWRSPPADGFVLVDSGAPKSGDKVMAALKSLAANAKVQTLFNTHYHADQTGNNEMFSAAGAKIIAHKRTLRVDVVRLLGSGRRSL